MPSMEVAKGRYRLMINRHFAKENLNLQTRRVYKAKRNINQFWSISGLTTYLIVESCDVFAKLMA